MNLCEEQSVEPRGLAPTAIALLEYLVQREQLMERKKNATYKDAAVDEWLIEACAARRRFRKIATAALRLTRQRFAMGILEQDYLDTLKRYRNRKEIPLIELVDEALNMEPVQRLIEQFGVPKNLIETLRNAIRRFNNSLRVSKDTLILIGPQGERRIINDTASASESSTESLLELIARTWALKGPGLAALLIDPRGEKGRPSEIGWTNGLAHALVNGAWFFNRDIRNLEDLKSFAEVEGSDVLAAAGIIIVVGLVLMLVGSCLKEENPTLAAVLSTIGAILTLAGIGVLANNGVPVTVCRDTIDPVTGMVKRTCATI